MFCKNCGKEIEDGTKFCPACGTAVEAGAQTTDSAEAHKPAAEKAEHGNTDSDSPGKNTATGTANKQTNETVKETLDSVSSNIERTNPLCIAGLVLTVIMFFSNYYGLVGFAALILSFLGYRAARTHGQKGTLLAIVCMAVAGITSLIFVIRLIEYQQYESAVYGGMNGLLEWLGDL